MTTIVEFLSQRWDEAEAAARAAAKEYPGPWENQGGGYGIRDTAELGIVAVGAFDYMDDEVADHIALNDPKTVLADIAAKRRILARHSPYDDADRDYCQACGGAYDPEPATLIEECPELQDLAAPFAAHPDYQGEWAP